MKTVEDFLNYITYRIVDNNNQCHSKMFARMIYNFLVDCEELSSEYQLETLKKNKFHNHVIIQTRE